ncbi:MAG: hypothetical protein WBG86_07940, partial [Polyangiales bacterium]
AFRHMAVSSPNRLPQFGPFPQARVDAPYVPQWWVDRDGFDAVMWRHGECQPVSKQPLRVGREQ